MENIRSENTEIIIVGDLNVKTESCGSRSKDKRGEFVEERMAALNVEPLNGKT